mgnify:CR=1 FL=1|jgi:hypothetical protein
MEEEFYATVKLLSGEELVSKVCYCSDEDVLILEKPLLVEPASHKKNGVEVNGFSLKEWIVASFDQMFVIDKKNVLTVTEVEKKIIEFYEVSLQKINNGNLTNSIEKLSRSSGYLGSVEKMKESLENIYKKS